MNALDAVKKRLEAITAGQWRMDEESYIVNVGDSMLCADVLSEDDARFIASSPIDMARLVAAIEGVLDCLGNHERQNPLGREQWNADIRATIENALSK